MHQIIGAAVVTVNPLRVASPCAIVVRACARITVCACVWGGGTLLRGDRNASKSTVFSASVLVWRVQSSAAFGVCSGKDAVRLKSLVPGRCKRTMLLAGYQRFRVQRLYSTTRRTISNDQETTKRPPGDYYAFPQAPVLRFLLTWEDPQGHKPFITDTAATILQ